VRVAIVEAIGRPPAPAEVPAPRRWPGEALVGPSGAWATPPPERQAALARAHKRAADAGGRLTLDTEELALDEIVDAWERLSRSAGRRLVVKP
jgi:hypothetical protein